MHTQIFRVVTLALILMAVSATPQPLVAQSEGIKVHGAWVIDVFNADGTLASHHEFKNALTREGASVLSGILSRVFQSFDFVIELQGSGSLRAVVFPENTGDGVILSAQVRNEGDQLTITKVGTKVFVCALANGSCDHAPVEKEFTERNIESITVVKGQIVQVKVTLSFS